MLTDRFVHAVAFAIRAHGNQVRKGTDVTYVSHLLGVASLVLDNGGDEDLAIAALLHDAVEDSDDNTITDQLQQQFGDRVTEIVLGCSDTTVHPKPPWRERKMAYITHLDEAPPEVLLVSACDKLHNARATVIDLHEHGPAFWRGGKNGVAFNASAADQIWYYESLLGAFRQRFANQPDRQPLLNELTRTITAMAALGDERID